MKLAILVFTGLLLSGFIISANAQMTAESPFERKFGDVKFLDAYFGTDQKIEVSPGDKNVPFTIVLANVGSQDITGISGQLQLPMGFSPSDGKGALILANSDSEAVAGSHFSLTFYVNLDKKIPIQQYPGNVKIDYSRLREAGQRTDFFEFKFKVTGESILNLKALDPFLTSLQNNKVVVEVSNTGSAPLSNIRIILQNTGSASDSSQTTTLTNVENVVFDQSDWSLGTIDSHSLKNFEFEVYVPEGVRSSTLHTIMVITYYDAQGNKVETKRTVDYFIKGLIDARLYNIGVIDISGKQTIIGDIINEGNTNALFAFVTLEPLNGSNIKKTTQFIDELETDSPVPFNIPVEFDGEPRYGDHDIKITVRYKDDLRNEHLISDETTITLKDTSKKPTPGVMDYLPEIGGLLAAGIIIFLVLKRRKREVQNSD